jgi:cyclophilin family peptidyl-prolyl cis-trans isomerase
MRSKFVVAALSGLFLAGMAFAQSSSPIPEPGRPVPPPDPQNILNIHLSTGGVVKVQLRPDKAPYSVDRVKTLVRRHFYDGLTFHRVIEGFMAQGGDPKGTGEGGSDLPDLKAEFNDLPHVRGTMSLARAEGLDTANSQFFIMLQPNLNLDGNYTAIGRVISGMQWVDKIEKGEPPEHPSKIVHASIESDDEGLAPAAFVPPAAVAATPASVAPVAHGKHMKPAKQTKAAKRALERDAREREKLDADKAVPAAPASQAPAPAPAPTEVAPSPSAEVVAPAAAPALSAKEKKQQEKQAKQAAAKQAKEEAIKAKQAKAAEAWQAAQAKQAEAAADKQAAQGKAAADKQAKEAAKAAKKAEEDAKKAAPAPAAAPEQPAAPAAEPAPTPPADAAARPQTSAAPVATDQAVAMVADRPATDAAVQTVPVDDRVAKPH